MNGLSDMNSNKMGMMSWKWNHDIMIDCVGLCPPNLTNTVICFGL